KDPHSAAVVVASLGRLGTPGAVAQLERLAADKDPSTSRVALLSLARAAPDKAGSVADRLLRSDDKTSRVSAVRMAGTLPQAAQERILVQAVHDADPGVVREAIANLGNVGTPTAQGALLDLLRSDATPKDVRTAAADALDQAGGAAAKDNADLIDRYKNGDEPHDSVPDSEDVGEEDEG
ncbi:MAG TPA: HEAT repeat domain-containing protein, partial [Polyangiaceae bacterium]